MTERSNRARAFRELLLVSTGKLISLAALFLCGVVVARSGGPAEYGIFAAALSLLLVLDACLGSPLDYAAVRFGALHADEPARVDRFQAATFRIKLSLGLALGLLALLMRRQIADWFFDAHDRAVVVIATVAALIALLLIRGTLAFLQINLRFRAYTLLDAAQGFLRLIALAGAAMLGAKSAEAFILIFACAAWIAFVASVFVIRQPYLTARWPEKADARAILTFIGATTITIALGTVTGRSDVFLISALLSAEDAGHYGAAAQVAMIVTMFASYACVILQPRLISLARQGSLKPLVMWNLAAAAALILIAIPAALWIVPWAVPFVFGPDFAPAVPILQVLVIGTCLDLLFMPVFMTYALQVRPGASMKGEIVITIGYVIAVALLWTEGVMAFAWIVTAVRAAKLILYVALTLGAMKFPAPTTAIPSVPEDSAASGPDPKE